MSTITARMRPTTDLPTARERAELILGHLDRLPAMPAVAARLLSLTASSDSCAVDVVRLLESDASLTAGLLRMARRSDLGIRAEGITVAKAVSLLGFKAVRNAVLSQKLHAALSAEDETEAVAHFRKELWKHSLGVACAAEMIAELRPNLVDRGEAFVCGLLHDLGKLALLACLPKSYARVINLTEQQHICICDAEREIFGLDHTVAGKRLASRWQLPAAVVECAWLHHHAADALPSTLVRPDLLGIVHAANLIARRQRIGFSGYLDGGDEAFAMPDGVDAGALSQLSAKLPARMEPYCELVGLEDMTGAQLSAESLAKANEELSRTNLELARVNEQLENRSACFDLLAMFAQSTTNNDREADVCAAAAFALRSAFDLPAALAFVQGDSPRLIHAGWSSQRTRMDRTVLDLHNDSDGPSDIVLGGATGSGVVSAPTERRRLWAKCFGHDSSERLSLLPISVCGEVRSGILFPTNDLLLKRLHALRSECTVIGDAVARALECARMRNNSDRMTEDLVDAHRRLRQAQAELVRGRTVAMIAKMAGGAAHEMATPLAVISGRAQLLRDSLTGPTERAALDTIVEHAKRVDSIATDLVEFARPAVPQPVSQSLVTVLEMTAEKWRSSSELRKDQLTVSLADPSVSCYVDPSQFFQMLDAVLANAVFAVNRETASVQINSPTHASDDQVRVFVRDNGVGMAPEVLEHAIDPFFSSRPAGRGRGLGLSRAFRLAEINGGRLALESTAGHGTTVTIEVPARPPHA